MNMKGGLKLMKPMGVTEEPDINGSLARAHTFAPANSGSSDVHKFAAILRPPQSIFLCFPTRASNAAFAHQKIGAGSHEPGKHKLHKRSNRSK